jgi:hypothetical protein
LLPHRYPRFEWCEWFERLQARAVFSGQLIGGSLH